MRKYVQVVLVVLSVFSLVTLLVYRHEYNKLRYVLEVLNFFGTPNTTLANASCVGGNQDIWPPPSWQRISNNINIYSAYYDELQDRDVVKGVAVGMLTENIKYGCYLWFNGVENPLQGQVSYSMIPLDKKQVSSKDMKMLSKMTKNRGLIFNCRLPDMPAIPYAVTFFKVGTFDINQAFIPMTMVYVTSGRDTSLKATAICIMPTAAKQISKQLFAEFISYHRSVDVQDFILYGSQSLWPGVSRENAINGRIHLLQWNYPFASDGQVMRSVAQADCELRTRSLWRNAITLYPDQLIIPKFHSTIGNIFDDVDASNTVTKFNIPVTVFCLEYDNDPKATKEMPIVFQKTRYIQPRTNLSITVNRGIGSVSRKMSKEIAAVHWYTKCLTFDDHSFQETAPKFDHSILRFNTEALLTNIDKLKNIL